jgi:signal transduction histidine kinase
VDLPPLLREEARKATRLYPGRRFDVDAADSLPPVYVDARRASQIIGTLLSNAALYSPADEAVVVTARAETDRVVVAVRDHGIGLTEREKSHVFDRAFQPERARDARREGLGLSLVIARQLAQLLGGDLWAESPTPGGGAIFSVAFPLLPAGYVVLE